MGKFPLTIVEFQNQFSSDQHCRDFLFKLRWPKGFVCRRCGHDEAWLTSRDLYHCRKCNDQISVTARTLFQDTRKPIQLWFHAMWYITSQKNGVSVLGLQRVLGLSRYQTVWFWLQKLRHAMVRPGRDKLCGTVEVDETFLGGPKPGKRGRGAAGKDLVMICVEDQKYGMGRIRLLRIENASGKSLLNGINKSVEDGSVIRTDGWKGYNGLRKKGFGHEVIREEDDKDKLLPLAHRVAALLKRWLEGTHQGGISGEYLDYYLDEFTFRFNRRKCKSRGKLFYSLVQQAISFSPFTESDIASTRSEKKAPT